MYNSLLEEMLDWAKSLKAQYDEAESSYKLAEVADGMADFLDEFINRAEDI